MLHILKDIAVASKWLNLWVKHKSGQRNDSIHYWLCYKKHEAGPKIWQWQTEVHAHELEKVAGTQSGCSGGETDGSLIVLSRARNIGMKCLSWRQNLGHNSTTIEFVSQKCRMWMIWGCVWWMCGLERNGALLIVSINSSAELMSPCLFSNQRRTFWLFTVTQISQNVFL